MAEAIVQFKEAVQALHHHPEAIVKKQAEQWLERFQEDVDAWTVCDAVLHDPTSTPEVNFMSAQALKRKVQQDFAELPSVAIRSLRESLVALLLKHGEGPVRTQLAVTMASLAAHLPAAEWDGIGALQWLAIRMTGDGSNPSRFSCLLELLIVFPQEAGSYRPAVHPERRRSFARELILESKSAITMITTCLEQLTMNTKNAYEHSLDAYAAWVRLSQGRLHADDLPVEAPQIDAATLCAHPLTLLALKSLTTHDSRPSQFDHAVDATCELIRATRTQVVDSRDSDRHSSIPVSSLQLVQVIVSSVLELKPALLAASQSEGSLDEIAKGISRLLAEIGEEYVAVIAEGNPESIAVVESILIVTAYPDTDIASMSFVFWHKLSNVLTGREQRNASHEGAGELIRRKQLFFPAYVQLIHNVIGRLQYPEDFQHWTREEYREFKRMRYAIADTLTEAASVVGAIQTLHIVSTPIQELNKAEATVLTPKNTGVDWRRLEASLYCVRSVSKEPPPAGDPLLLSILASLPNLPEHPQLLYTAVLTISAYSEWVSASIALGTDSVLLQKLLGVLHRALVSTHTDTRGAAALALKHICDAAADHLVTFLDPLVQLYVMALNSMTDSQGTTPHLSSPSTSHHFQMHADDVIQIIEGLGHVTTALPVEQADPVFSALLAPISVLLNAMFPEVMVSVKPDTNIAVKYFDCLAAVMRYVSHPELVATSFHALWPMVSRALVSCGNTDMRCTEHICRCIKYAIRTSGHRLTDIVNSAASMYTSLFAQRRQASLLFAVSELVRSFGNDISCSQAICLSVEEVILRTAESLKTLSDFDDAPDVVDDAFLLLKTCLKYCPKALANPQIVASTLDMIEVCGLHVQHREACCSMLDFTRNLLYARNEDLVDILGQVLPPRGGALVRSLLAGALGALPSSRLSDISGVIAALLSCTNAQSVVWLREATSLIPDHVASASDKDVFFHSVSRFAESGDGHTLGKSLDDLSELCRRSKRHRIAVAESLLKT